VIVDATMAGHVMGTPMYMAPEQAMGNDKVDHRSDLFGLGVTCFEALTGLRPRQFDGELNLDRISREPIAAVADSRRDVPKELNQIICSLTALSKSDRYSSAQQFVSDLENYRYGGRRPHGATTGNAFIAMPFQRRFDSLFDCLQDTCSSSKLAAMRVDRVLDSTGVWQQIDQDIREATVVIAVFTRPKMSRSPNANVLTEAAHARAIGKPLIVLTTDPAEKLPFDWRHVPIVRYRPTSNGLNQLTLELGPRLRHLLRSKDEVASKEIPPVPTELPPVWDDTRA